MSLTSRPRRLRTSTPSRARNARYRKEKATPAILPALAQTRRDTTIGALYAYVEAVSLVGGAWRLPGSAADRLGELGGVEPQAVTDPQHGSSPASAVRRQPTARCRSGRRARAAGRELRSRGCWTRPVARASGSGAMRPAAAGERDRAIQVVEVGDAHPTFWCAHASSKHPGAACGASGSTCRARRAGTLRSLAWSIRARRRCGR
jgi:hypothetical protein